MSLLRTSTKQGATLLTRRWSSSVRSPWVRSSRATTRFVRCSTWSIRESTIGRVRYKNNALLHYWHAAPVVGFLAGSSWELVGVTSCESKCDPHAISNLNQADLIAEEMPSLEPTGEWNSLMLKLRRVWRMIMRLIKLSFTLTPVVAFYPILMLLNDRDPTADAHQIALMDQDGDALEQHAVGFLGWYLRMCLSCVEWSGAAVIKLMQWAGSRPDLFGKDFCAVFSKLQDNTTPHRWKHTEDVMREAYGDNWKERIRLKEILGSGCIGQVYRGEVTCKNSGKSKQVAVKVLHPNVEEDIDADLDLMRAAVRFLEWLPFEVFANLKWLNMEGVVEEFAGLLKLQLDLRQEAINLQRFNENFKDNPEVEFPQLVAGFPSTKHVLMESFCDGVPVLQFARENKADPEKLHNLCLSAVRAVCKMIFLDNFMHGDLHPGNVFVSTDGNRFILFDVGIVAEYTEKDHDNIVDILTCFIRYDGRRAGRLMIDDSNSRLRAAQIADAAVEEEGFMDKIEALSIKARGKDYLMEHLGEYISYICNAAAHHHIMLNPSFASAALAVKVEEGIALALDPAIKIWKVATPIIVESERRRGLVKSPLAKIVGLDIPWIQHIFRSNSIKKSNDDG